jgi:hypothetical protein
MVLAKHKDEDHDVAGSDEPCCRQGVTTPKGKLLAQLRRISRIMKWRQASETGGGG